MNKSSKINFAQEQLAILWNCSPNLFKQNDNVFIQSNDTFFNVITFGKNAVIKVDPLIYEWCVENFSTTPAHFIINRENLFAIEAKLREFGKMLGGEQVRYLYLHNDKLINKPCDYEYKLFYKDNIRDLYINKVFNNALNYKNDVIAFGAYKENQLVALAGADETMGKLWQIGIDTLPEHRNKGLAAYLVKTLADEIEKCDMMPFYTTWSPNIASTTVALNTGFFPIWVSYVAQDISEA
ncbi:hypothetical protein CSC2_08740 [Clostridium zeae]|uniref:GNAT family N-acetyltransferase n=1 Tax=Clostridium zeae TaxID=2759022 RepID=A0ABQ1E761_9CLOT|nr:GNAT family N-acetyltransferase [Clostridium zeae]GFZ30348.1 hypothetical protein CSC2_08740 [Clostridium zeae]